jgi:hypothetical protein
VLVEGVVKTLAGATEAADFGLDLDAMASEAFPEVLPKFPTTKRNVSPIVRNNASPSIKVSCNSQCFGLECSRCLEQMD